MNTAEVYLKPSFADPIPAPPVAEPALVRVPQIESRHGGPRRWATIATFFLADLAGYAFTIGLLFLVFGWSTTNSVLPAISLLIVAYAIAGLYRATNVHPAEEIRRVTIVTMVFFAACIATMWVSGHNQWSELKVWLAAWILSSIIVPSIRALSRVMFARTSWWGLPVVVLSSGNLGAAVINTLKRWPELGFKPTAILQDDLPYHEIGGVPLLGNIKLAPYVATKYHIPCAIIAAPGLEHRQIVDLLGQYTRFFKRVLVIPGIQGSSALWSSDSFAGLMGYGVQHSYWSRFGRLAKRIVDVLAAFFALILLSPLFSLLALLIKIDSPGSVFYKQTRMGLGGHCFKVLKFRTMYLEADKELHEILQKDPVLRREYEVYRKLQNDPRVTRMGRMLRRFSLDELPQIWNVLVGDMSLVGPRAYMTSEISHMEGLERIILQNRPGITGLWQVSGRNMLSFEERVDVDVHYVHHWTPWLDLYILARTIPVVLTGEGAS